MTVDFRIENIDAVGKIKKKEFSIYNMAVWGGDPVNIYRIVYFSEAGKVDAEQVYHYNLGQGGEPRCEGRLPCLERGYGEHGRRGRKCRGPVQSGVRRDESVWEDIEDGT